MLFRFIILLIMLNSSCSVKLNGANDPRNPQYWITNYIMSILRGIKYVNSPFTFTVNQSIGSISPDVTKTPNTYAVTPDLPTGLSLDANTGTLSGVPINSQAAQLYTITAKGENFNASTSISITIELGISYPNSPYSLLIGNSVSISPKALWTPTSYLISPALISGLTINTTSGIISGTPTVTSGAVNYAVSVMNGTTLAGATSLKISVGINVITFAGSGTSGSTDATGTAASFNSPEGLTIDSSGNIYVADFGNHRIRKITSTGVVTTFAGTGFAGSADATGTAASFNNPYGLTIDSGGNIYVGDYSNHKIRKITSGGVVTTLAGSGTSGSTDATGTSASFKNPTGVTVDSSGNVYVADLGNHTIRKVTSGGVVTTLAGLAGTSGFNNATGSAARFNGPFDIVVDSSGNIYVADFNNHRIRMVSTGGVVTTFAGSGTSGSIDGTGTTASFAFPVGITLDSTGNLFVTEGNNKIRMLSSTSVVTTLAGTGTAGSTNGNTSVATFNGPAGVIVDGVGNIYVGDRSNNKIRKIIRF